MCSCVRSTLRLLFKDSCDITPTLSLPHQHALFSQLCQPFRSHINLDFTLVCLLESSNQSHSFSAPVPCTCYVLCSVNWVKFNYYWIFLLAFKWQHLKVTSRLLFFLVIPTALVGFSLLLAFNSYKQCKIKLIECYRSHGLKVYSYWIYILQSWF